MKKILIIGGGIAGLSAGIYAQILGFQSVLYEQHFQTGGECTGWDREGFHIDGCIHWLMGTLEGTGLNNVWQKVGALQKGTEIYQPEMFVRSEFRGTAVLLYRDLERLKAHLLKISPKDRVEIEKLCGYIESFFGFEPPIGKPVDLMNPVELALFLMSMRKIGPVTRELGKLTVREYCERFSHPAIQKALSMVVPEYYQAYLLPSSMATFMSGNGGRPVGGSRAMARRMEQTYLRLGGELRLRNEVVQIVVEKGSAKGIVLKDGTQVSGDYIIPCCDPHITFEKLLEGRYSDKRFEERYGDKKTYPLQTSVNVALGVDADLSDYPEDLIFQTEMLGFEDKKTDTLSCKHYGYEPSFAPNGKTVMNVHFPARYEWWKNLNPDEYALEKIRLGSDVLRRIEGRFPELTGKIKIIDVATPLTYQRYCGAYKGSWMAFGATPKGKRLMHNGRVKGIKNLYMGGQWLMPPGGLPVALLTGKWAIARICKAEGIRFSSETGA